MNLPFGINDFLDLFQAYNQTIAPIQIVMYIFAIIAILFLLLRKNYAVKTIFAVLGIMWLINGLGYHILFFAGINPIAKGFGVLFLIQSVLFFMSFLKTKPSIPTGDDIIPHIYGWLMVFYSMVGYSGLGLLFGHVYPFSPVFGVAPCPTVIFTFGILMVLKGYYPRYLAIIPLIWSVIGSTATFKLGMIEDLGLITSALLFLLVGGLKKK